MQRGPGVGAQPGQERGEPGRLVVVEGVPAELGVVRHRLGGVQPGLGGGPLAVGVLRVDAAVHRRGDPAQQLAALPDQHPEPLFRGGGLLAAARRAEPGDALLGLDPVQAAERGEQVVRVLRVVRRRALLRVAPGEHRRQRVGRPAADAGGVAVPGRPGRERGEVRVAGGVDPAVRAEQGHQRQLVQHDHDHRRVRARAGHPGRAALAARQHHRRGRRGEQEQPDEHQRPGGGHPQHPPGRPPPPVRGRPGGSGHTGGDKQGYAPKRRDVPADLDGQRGEQQADERGVHGGPDEASGGHRRARRAARTRTARSARARSGRPGAARRPGRRGGTGRSRGCGRARRAAAG